MSRDANSEEPICETAPRLTEAVSLSGNHEAPNKNDQAPSLNDNSKKSEENSTNGNNNQIENKEGQNVSSNSNSKPNSTIQAIDILNSNTPNSKISTDKPSNSTDPGIFSITSLITNIPNGQPKVIRNPIIKHQSQSPTILHHTKSVSNSSTNIQRVSTQPPQPQRKPLQPIPLIQLPIVNSNSNDQIQRPRSPKSESPYPTQTASQFNGFSSQKIRSPNAQYSQPFQPPTRPSNGVYNVYRYQPAPNFYQYANHPPPQTLQMNGWGLHINPPPMQINVIDSGMPQIIQIPHSIPPRPQVSQITPISVSIPSQQQPQPSIQIVPPQVEIQVKKPMQNLPLPQLVVVHKPLQTPAISNESEDANDMKPPDPTFYHDKETGEYGVRCVCGDGHIDSLLVQCEMCDFWLHGLCVNVARETKGESFFCPFCLKRKIRCKCGESMKYSMPIIQCTKCQMWVHKQCENLDFGINPDNFVCSFCGGGTYELKEVEFTDDDDDVFDGNVDIDDDQRSQIVNSIPDGHFKNMIIEDLQKPQINFRWFVAKYFHEFAPYLFDRAHEFWRVFNETLCSILKCQKSALLNALDALAIHLLYKPFAHGRETRSSGRLIKGFSHSESITEFLEKNDAWPRFEKQQTPVRIYCRDGRIFSPVALDEGAFIAELPGFLMHTDEIKVENGIPLTCLVVTDNDVIIDTEGTTFTFAPLIRRSFHFNCIVKLIRIKGEPRIGLFATKMKGPLSEEKSRRGPAIRADGELFLPFDGEIPFPVAKVDWKDKKRGKRAFSKSSGKSADFDRDDYFKKTSNQPSSNTPRSTTKITTRSGRRSANHAQTNTGQNQTNGRKSQDENSNFSYLSNPASHDQLNLTLLSSFYDPAVPPMPFVILEDDEAVNRYKVRQEVKSKTMSTRGRHRNSD